MLDALGENAELIVSLVPELSRIIGPQSPPPELQPEEAQIRFHATLKKFLGVFASEKHPLALFLDDLQWLDMATLDLSREWPPMRTSDISC